MIKLREEKHTDIVVLKSQYRLAILPRFKEDLAVTSTSRLLLYQRNDKLMVRPKIHSLANKGISNFRSQEKKK